MITLAEIGPTLRALNAITDLFGGLANASDEFGGSTDPPHPTRVSLRDRWNEPRDMWRRHADRPWLAGGMPHTTLVIRSRPSQAPPSPNPQR